MDDQRGLFERPDSPARAFAVAAGLFLLALGVLALVFDDVSFDPVGRRPPHLLIWGVSGWTTILWIAMGGLGLTLAGARSYPLLAAGVFGVAAVWGFIDGHAVAAVLVAGTANNVTHAALAGLGLLASAEGRWLHPSWPSARLDEHAL
jgi:hypothetical protein